MNKRFDAGQDENSAFIQCLSMGLWICGVTKHVIANQTSAGIRIKANLGKMRVKMLKTQILLFASWSNEKDWIENWSWVQQWNYKFVECYGIVNLLNVKILNGEFVECQTWNANVLIEHAKKGQRWEEGTEGWRWDQGDTSVREEGDYLQSPWSFVNQVHITNFADTGVMHNLVESLCHGQFIIGYVLCESFQTTTNFLFGQCHVQNHSVFDL